MLNEKIFRISKISLIMSLFLICWAGVSLSVDDIHNGIGDLAGLTTSCEYCGIEGGSACPIKSSGHTCTGIHLPWTCYYDLYCPYQCPLTTGLVCDQNSDPDSFCTDGSASCGTVLDASCNWSELLSFCYCGGSYLPVDCGRRSHCFNF